MSIAIADHIRDIPRSGIRDFFEIVQSMDDVISLGIGEPDFATPWHIREAAIYALERGRTRYTSNLGEPRLRRSISDYINNICCCFCSCVFNSSIYNNLISYNCFWSICI